ncbi:MAG: hypothetical protein A4E30_00303 [Methanomassiliicoccales archaeon PtaB.Bin215]|nr:MAG: hypothetical protein A4E30_00303 [Methanomassiliicoccales archaeon PtaB.Bin215]
MVADPLGTRREAYAAIGDARTMRQKVYEILKKGSRSDYMVAEVLGVPINRVVPRRQELVQAGKVRAAYRDRNEATGASCTIWEVVQ